MLAPPLTAHPVVLLSKLPLVMRLAASAVVSILNILFPAAFCIWKAVAESLPVDGLIVVVPVMVVAILLPVLPRLMDVALVLPTFKPVAVYVSNDPAVSKLPSAVIRASTVGVEFFI